ncbi:MAG: DUF86 domain-containing protein [Pseudomonadota bacterium]
MKDDLMYLEHIIDSIEHIKKYIGNIDDVEDFTNDDKLCDAVVRRLGIVGEASSKISKTLRSKYNLIEWRQIIDTRNLLIHGYFGVSYTEVWGIIKQDVPELEKQIKNIINDLKNKNGH